MTSKNMRMAIDEELFKGCFQKYYESEELRPYQAELIKLQHHLEDTQKKW